MKLETNILLAHLLHYPFRHSGLYHKMQKMKGIEKKDTFAAISLNALARSNEQQTLEKDVFLPLYNEYIS